MEHEGLTRLPVSSKQEGYLKKLGDKDFTDLLGPLHNYLRQSCGRPWDDVYSEIPARWDDAGPGACGISSARIWWPSIPIAVPTATSGFADGHGVHKAGGLFYDYYVEPETGILREGAQYRKWRSIARVKEAKKVPDFLPIGNGKEYRKIDGIWYFHEFSEVETKAPVFWRGSFYGWDSKTPVICRVKRQLSKKQLKQLGVRNG